MAQAGGRVQVPADRPHLREGSVGLGGDFVAAVTNVAPSAAVALTLGSIIAVSGLATPFLVIVVGLAMLCIAFAYHHLNLWQPTPGAQVMWIARAVTPLLGFAAGILLILESSVSNIANISLMGPYLLGIFSSDAASNPVLEYITSLVIMAIVCAIAVIGIRAAIRFQTYILWIEYGIMLIFALVVYWADFTGSSGATAPSLSWFTPSASPTGLSGIVAGIVITVFMFGGWEAAVYLGEEQRSAHRDPGRAAIICVIFCTIWFVFYLANSGIAAVLAAVTATAGYLYAMLYIVVALACIWYYRRTLGKSSSQLFYAGILPAIGALFLIYCVVAGLIAAPSNILIPTLIFILVGVPAAFIAMAVTKSDFWHPRLSVTWR